MRRLRTEPLTPDRVGQAFPLVQAVLPDVHLGEWSAFATSLMTTRLPPRTGILVVLSELDYIAGLSIYRVDNDLRHGCALSADQFLALDLFDRGAVVHALAEALEAVARDNGCTALHTVLPERTVKGPASVDGLMAMLYALGHRVETIRLCKRLASTPPVAPAP